MKPSDLLSDESKWCQQNIARTVFGIRVGPYNPLAVKWCALGAIRKCNYPVQELADYVQRMGYGGITQFNDTHTHAEVIAALKAVGL